MKALHIHVLIEHLRRCRVWRNSGSGHSYRPVGVGGEPQQHLHLALHDVQHICALLALPDQVLLVLVGALLQPWLKHLQQMILHSIQSGHDPPVEWLQSPDVAHAAQAGQTPSEFASSDTICCEVSEDITMRFGMLEKY